MAVELKSGSSTDLATVDATSKAIRVTNYNADGSVVDTTVPISIAVNPVTVVNNDIIASFDVSAYKFVSLQLTGTWVGEVKFQGSNDNGTFEDIVVQNTGDVLTPYVLSMAAVGGVKIPVLFKFLRVRVTAYTSGTVEGTAFGLKEDANTGQISSVGTVNIGAGQTVATVTNLEQLGGEAVSMGAGVVNAGTQRVVLASDDPVSLAAGTNFIGKISISPGEDLLTSFILGTTGTNAANMVAAPCILRAIVFTNYAATARHLKLYNTAGTPTAGSAGVVIQCSMAAAGTLVYPLPVEGFTFSTGIGRTMVLGAEESSTSPATTEPDFSVSLIYQLL